MNFLTSTYLILFTLTVLGTYLLPRRCQNGLLLAANYIFYLWANPILGLLLAAATLVGYGCARAMERVQRRRLCLTLGLLCLFGALFVFKYLDFFCQTFLDLTGLGGSFRSGLVLPIGISFYSFSLAGYLFDVYRHKITPERNLLDFAVFASLFPSILCGPINRARELLPQLKTARRFEAEAVQGGLWRFLCGAAKKLVAASLLGDLIDPVWADPAAFGSGAWIIAAAAYSLYIYLDFSAYSDMAIGSAQVLGLRLMENFTAPYLSRSVKSFWKKWHISLTSWFREYLYFPLGGSRKGKARTRINVLIVFTVSGLWHGAGYTFLLWGLLNGVYQVLEDVTQDARFRLHRRLRIREDNRGLALVQGLLAFALVTIAWVFFRAPSLDQALFALARMALVFRDGVGPLGGLLARRGLLLLGVSLGLCLWEDVRITRSKSRTPFAGKPWRCWLSLAGLAFFLLLFGRYGPGFDAQDFVYFKF